MLTEVLLFLTFLFFLAMFMVQRPRDLPPGPRPLPIIGNLVQLALSGSKKSFVTLDQFAKKYGDVFMVRFGSTDFAILSSYEAMIDTLGKDAWSGRIFNDALAVRSLNQRLGIIFLEGNDWQEQRRFTIRHLRDFGFGKQQSMESVIEDELNELMSRLRQKMADGLQAVVHMNNFFTLSVLNILWRMMGGVRYHHDDARLLELLQKVNNIFKSGSLGGNSLADLFPILRKIAPDWTGETAQVDAYRCLQSFFRESIDEHRKSPTFGSSNDFIDVYLQEIDRQKENQNHLFKEDQLIQLCLDLFMAGSETTSNSLSYGILYMILYPEIQKKVYEEIISVVGRKRHPTLDDRLKLPYTEAVLMEIQRLGNIAPFTPPHEITEEVHYKGYRIPKKTLVLVNLYSVHMNKDHWKDPESFRPERFLDQDGKVIKDEHLIPFGIGKRICLGESLARMSLFLYFTTVLQNFKFETVPGHLDPTTEPIPGFTISPSPYNAVVSRRPDIK